MSNDFYTRNGWYPRLYINGDRVADNIIHGSTIAYTHSENDAAQLTVTLQPSSGAQDLNKYQGKSIILDVKVASGVYRVFTGIIDIDEYDILKERIVLRCTDNRANVINTKESVVETIGYWSEDVFGRTDDVNKKLENRLSTIPYSYDMDGSGNFHLTSWTPKGSADYTFGNSDVYRREPSVQRTKRADIINTITLDFKYNYTRLHHRELVFSWSSGVTACEFLVYGHSLCTKDMVRKAVNAVGWPLRSAISFTPLYASGMYTCSTQGGNVRIGFTGTSTLGVNYAKTSEVVVNGQASSVGQYDKAGNYYQTAADIATYSAANLLCIGAQWTATKRWVQSVTESYTLTITSPQSVSQYGALSRKDSFAVTDEYDSSAWENYTTFSSQPSGATNIYDNNENLLADYYIDQSYNRQGANNASLVIINKARTEILKSHRNNKINFQLDISPHLDLRHTVALSCTKLSAKGKVSKLNHVFNVGEGDAYTEVELSYYQSEGSGSDSTYSIPTAPSDSVRRAGGVIPLGSHYGKDPTTSDAANWNGHIGNLWKTVNNNYFKTQYPEAFIVDTPAIEPQFRDLRTLAASQTYNVGIPNNPVTITFSGKLS